MKPTHEQMREIVEDDDYEEIERDKHHRHNEEWVTIVFAFGGTHWMTQYYQSADWGIMWDESFEDVDEVKEVEVVTKKWVAVADS